MIQEQSGPQIGLLQFAALGLVQGLALVVLTVHAVTSFAGADVTMAARQFVVMAPVLYMLSAQPGRWREPTIFAIAVALPLALLYLWAEIRFGRPGSKFYEVLFPAIISAAFIVTVVLPLFQTWLIERRLRIPYALFFENAWNNAITLAVGGLFVGAAWLLLWLWASLFELVNITFFGDVFGSRLFALPFSGLAGGVSLAIIRRQERIVRSIRDLALGLFAVLAPVLAVAGMLFLAALPFTGLAPLWDTGHATGVLLTVAFGAVFLVNAVIRDGTGGPPSRVLTILLGVQLALAPVIAGLAIYATALRVGQYGLTPERVHALILAACACLWAAAYAYAVVRWRPAWPDAVRRYNLVLGCVTALVALATLTPLLDPYGLSAHTQMQRLVSGRVAPAEFDLGLLKFKLGAPGRAALERIRTDGALPQREVLDRNLAAVDESTRYWHWKRNLKRQREYGDAPEKIFDAFIHWPADVQPDQSLRQFLLTSKHDYLAGCANKTPAVCALLAVDLVGDGAIEFVFVRRISRYSTQFYGFRRDRDSWAQYDQRFLRGTAAAAAWKDIEAGAVAAVAPTHRVLRLGDQILPLLPRQ